MNIDINILINAYKEELIRLQNENVLLKAQVAQLEKIIEDNSGGDEQ